MGTQGIVKKKNNILVGVSILKQGGNAIDAAIATAICLGVRRPFASGIGGGGFMLIHKSDNNSQVFLDFRERAPMAASKNMFVGRERDSIYTALGAGVPGEIAGKFAMSCIIWLHRHV